MPLTAIQVKQAAPMDKDRWLSDEKGLRLLIKANGSKYWRLKYRFNGKQKTLAVGVYPEISLKDARKAVVDARTLIRNGQDPSLERKILKRQYVVDEGSAFDVIARDWWEQQKDTWTNDHASRVWSRLKDNAFSDFAHRPIVTIEPQNVISVIRKIESRGALDVANRVLQDIRRVCRYAVQMGLLTHNPAAELGGILKATKTTHRASLPREELPRFLKELANYDEIGRLLTRLAVQLLLLTFVRPGELRGARWSEFDLENRLWRIPGDRMKMGTDHLVPLSSQSLAIIDQLKPITGKYDLVFPSERNRMKSMSDNTMRKAIFTLGYDGTVKGKSKATPHGFRATASSILNESGFNPDAIERQLSHMERNSVRAAYTHHARYLKDREEMMQWWADYLENLCGNG